MRDRRAWFLTLYRDEPDEASADVKGMGWYENADIAKKVAAELGPTMVREAGWSTWSATVDQGWIIPYVTSDGVTLWEWDDDVNGDRWYLGPDWTELEHRSA